MARRQPRPAGPCYLLLLGGSYSANSLTRGILLLQIEQLVVAGLVRLGVQMVSAGVTFGTHCLQIAWLLIVYSL